MTVGIIGLGLIGGSLAKALKEKTSHRVLGYNRSEEVVSRAIEIGAIDGELCDENLSVCDVVFVALYPDDAVNFIETNKKRFKKNSIVMDCCGTKRKICCRLERISTENGFYFVGGHPMAGIEKSGFDSSFPALFQNASLILTPYGRTPRLVTETLSALAKDLGFGRVQLSTPEEHDALIAYTSQLAHAVSAAYVQSPLALKTEGFSAGSFKDMTRVARLNEQMWAQLFIENKDDLCREITGLCERLKALEGLISSGNTEELKTFLKRSRLVKEALER